MMTVLSTYLRRYWIAVAVLTFALLTVYTNDATFGQAATPTPDVNTVPRPDEIATPTNTPFPSPTPMDDNNGPPSGGGPRATPTAVSPNDNNNDQGGNNPSNNTGNTANDSGNTAPDAPGAIITGTVSSITLNVRKAPTTGASIVDTIFMGEGVQILGRDSGGGWWYICCGSGAGRPGWVSAQFITIDGLTDALMATIPVTANTSAPGVDGSTALTSTNGLTLPLVLEMRPSPAFVWQGQTVQLQFIVHNRSNQPLTNIELRNDLPPTLRYINTATSDQGEVITAGNAADGVIFTIDWPEIAAGTQLTATVTLQVASNANSGALIDNLAVVNTAEGAEALAGITFAMPPTRPPRFR